MVRRKSGHDDVNPDTLSVVDAAVYWAERGIAVFPCSNKRPLTQNGFKDAVKDPAKAKQLFEFYGDAATMVGASMGDPSGMFAIDFDLYKGPEVDAWMQALIEKGLLPETRIHKTARGGIHVFYNGGELPKSSYPTDGVEVRGNGAYVIFPGGNAGYSVLSETISPAPSALLSYLASIKKEQSTDTIDGLKAKILAADNYHDSLARLAARYAAMGKAQEEVLSLLREVLSKSIASNPTHPRHERWKFLMDNQENELVRTVSTAHKKYNSQAARDEFTDRVDEEVFEKMKKVAEAAFKQRPHDRETETDSVKSVEDWNGEWPFSEEGYFAHHDHDLLSQRFVLHPILCEDESVLIAAEPKTGKTAVALTVGLHVAVGRDLGPSLRVAEPRGVLYFGLEGRRAIRLRIAAWRRHQRELGENVPDFIPLFVVERSKNLLQENARINLANAIAAAELWLEKEYGVKLGLIVLDTLTKAMPGGDQNSVDDTSAVFDVVGRVREIGVSAAVVFIHHKARAGNIRGSTNIEADPDVLTSIFKEGNKVIWSLDRARSVEEGGRYHFQLHNYSLGTSSQGFPINAPVVEAVDADEPSTVDIAAAKEIGKAMALIIALGEGTHKLSDVHKILVEAGLAPYLAGMRRVKPRPAPWNSKIAQDWYEQLIPVTGYIYAGVSCQRLVVDGITTGIHIF